MLGSFLQKGCSGKGKGGVKGVGKNRAREIGGGMAWGLGEWVAVGKKVQIRRKP